MECIAKKCSSSNSTHGYFLTCWLCDGLAHVKCAGFNGRHFDWITSKNSGLRWSCWNCRGFDVDFYRLFKEAKSGFSNLNADACSLSSKLSKLETMFNKFTWPENLSTSPAEKRVSRGKDRRAVSESDVPLTPNWDFLGNMLLSPLPSAMLSGPTPVPPPSQSHSVVSGESIDVVSIGNIPASSSSVSSTLPSVVLSEPTPTPPPSQSPSDGSVESVEDVVSVDNIPATLSSSSSKGRKKMPTTKKPPSKNVPSAPAGSNENTVPIQIPNLENTIGDLVVVPPRKTVFISRLSADTSVEQISQYLRLHAVDFNASDWKVLKFNYSEPRDISSFRIIVPERLFRVLVNQSFWPPGVLVREFVPRNNSRRAPPVVLQPSKN